MKKVIALLSCASLLLGITAVVVRPVTTPSFTISSNESIITKPTQIALYR